jgi:thioredoxin 2
MVAPHLVKIAEQEKGRLIIAKVDTEARPELGQRFRITAIPTMVVFKTGAEVARQAGAMAAPGIRQFVSPWL